MSEQGCVLLKVLGKHSSPGSSHPRVGRGLWPSSSIFKTSQVVALWSFFHGMVVVSMFSPLSVIRLGSPGSSQTLSPSQGSGFNHSSSLRTFRSSESLCRVHHKLWRHHTSTVGSVLVSSFLSPPVCFSHDFSSSDESGKVDHTSVYASFFSLLRVGPPTSLLSCWKEPDISSCPFIIVSPLIAWRSEARSRTLIQVYCQPHLYCIAFSHLNISGFNLFLSTVFHYDIWDTLNLWNSMLSPVS